MIFIKTFFLENNGRFHPVTDNDITNFEITLQKRFYMSRVTRKSIEYALLNVAKRKINYAPRDCLVTWDGVNRMESFFTVYLGASDNAYSMAVSKYFLTSLAARIIEPGHKADIMTILESKQGTGKGKALEALAGPEWYGVVIEKPSKKDFYQNIRGKILMELAELDSIEGMTDAAIKSLLGRSSDDYRPSYAKRAEKIPRPCIFVGTTNEKEYLKDVTGNRRYLPIEVANEKKIDVEAIKKDRDQLLAEAAENFKKNKKTWWKIPDELVEPERAKRMETDPWQDEIEEFLEEHFLRHEYVTFDDVLAFLFNRKYVAEWQKDRKTTNRIGKIMRVLGYGDPKAKCVKIGEKWKTVKVFNEKKG